MIDLRNLSNKEKEAIEELRKRVEKDLDPVIQEDETLYYRFLKEISNSCFKKTGIFTFSARDFNIDKAEKMLKKHITWRKAKQVNTMLENFVPKEVFLKFIEPSYFGVDKKGDLIIQLPSGKLNSRDIMQCIQFNDNMDHVIWFTERILSSAAKFSKEPGQPAKTYKQVVLLLDLEELTFSNATSKATVDNLLGALRIVSDNYPETMNSICIINAPRYYSIPFSILKNFMSEAMVHKFSVFGKDSTKEALLKSIDADVLPAFLGGNRTDPDGDPLCKTFVSHGHIPLPLYSLSDEERYFKDKLQIKKVSIPNNGRKEIAVDVTKEGSVIQWEFLVKDKDIGIGLYRKDLEVIEILPVLRYYTVDGTTTISYKTKTAGKYILVFDNSYSWMKSKVVEYTVKVVKPEN